MSDPIRIMGLKLNWRMGLGVVLILAGAVLALALPDLKFFWFEGRPLGILLLILGAVEIGDGVRRARGHAPRSMVEELKDDFGIGKPPSAGAPNTNADANRQVPFPDMEPGRVEESAPSTRRPPEGEEKNQA